MALVPNTRCGTYHTLPHMGYRSSAPTPTAPTCHFTLQHTSQARSHPLPSQAIVCTYLQAGWYSFISMIKCTHLTSFCTEPAPSDSCPLGSLVNATPLLLRQRPTGSLSTLSLSTNHCLHHLRVHLPRPPSGPPQCRLLTHLSHE